VSDLARRTARKADQTSQQLSQAANQAMTSFAKTSAAQMKEMRQKASNTAGDLLHKAAPYAKAASDRVTESVSSAVSRRVRAAKRSLVLLILSIVFIYAFASHLPRALVEMLRKPHDEKDEKKAREKKNP